ncbi:MAG: F0F1 ATP synthase subunit B [Actinobacteria bacterium]|nr:F0F1 ATP synthase subunit B [Actinomycetota bacterium]
MLLAGNFLIPNATFIAELVAFLLILGILAKYILPWLNKLMSERQAEIASALENAAIARKTKEDIEAERAGILQQAHLQARKILEQANQLSEKIKSDAVLQGQKEHERLLKQAEADVALSFQQALKDARVQIGELAIQVAEKILIEELDNKRQQELIDRAVSAIANPPTDQSRSSR